MNILIVDDERIILQGLKACIEGIREVKCFVETATNARQALQRMEACPVDLLLTDIEMPCGNGLELIEKASKRGLYKHCVILSSYDKFEYAQSAIRFGVNDYLLKPLDREELVRNICGVAAQIGQSKELEELQRFRPLMPHAMADDVPPALQRYYQYIKEHFQQELSLGSLADTFGKNENYLCNLFKKEWDVTFLELVNEFRLQMALFLLLRERKLTVADIAVRVGYQTERQLFRLLKKKTGLTPQQLRHGVEPAPAADKAPGAP